MANEIKLKRSAVAAKVPLTTDLALGELAINTYDGKVYLKKNDGSDAIVEIGGSSGASVQLEWKFDTVTTTADPGSKSFRFNNSTPASVTEIYFNDTTNGGADVSTLFAKLSVGDQLYIQQQDTGANFLIATISSITDNTGWWTLAVTIDDSGTLIGNNKVSGVVMLYTSTGGTASPLTTKGDIYTYDTGDARLAVGTDGQVLTADAASATGVKWAAATGGGGGSAAGFEQNFLIMGA